MDAPASINIDWLDVSYCILTEMSQILQQLYWQNVGEVWLLQHIGLLCDHLSNS